jgi:hypothetical protein
MVMITSNKRAWISYIRENPVFAIVHGLRLQEYFRQNSFYPLQIGGMLSVTAAADLVGLDKFAGPLHHYEMPVIVVIAPSEHGDQMLYNYAEGDRWLADKFGELVYSDRYYSQYRNQPKFMRI